VPLSAQHSKAGQRNTLTCSCGDHSVYLLDYTSEVEVTGCTSCQIFIGADARLFATVS
jgi:hypothetical protein